MTGSRRARLWLSALYDLLATMDKDNANQIIEMPGRHENVDVLLRVSANEVPSLFGTRPCV